MTLLQALRNFFRPSGEEEKLRGSGTFGRWSDAGRGWFR